MRRAVSFFEWSRGLLTFGSGFDPKEEQQIVPLSREEPRDKDNIASFLISKKMKKKRGRDRADIPPSIYYTIKINT